MKPIPPPLPPSCERASDPAASTGGLEYTAMKEAPGLFSVAEVLLKKPGQIAYEVEKGNSWGLFRLFIGIGLVSFLIFGLTAGMFSWGSQVWAAPLKITGGIFFSTLICYPSLFIFTCLSGLDVKPKSCLILLAGLVAVCGLLLLGFGPVCWVFSQSTNGLFFLGAMNLAFWVIAVVCGVRFLKRAILSSQSRRAGYLGFWVSIFLLVTLQMTTTLRPILGRSDTFLTKEKKFFLSHWGDVVSGRFDASTRNAKPERK